MPLFDFKCSNCGHTEEVLLKLSQNISGFIVCEKCRGYSYRTLSAPACVIVRNNKPNKRRYEG